MKTFVTAIVTLLFLSGCSMLPRVKGDDENARSDVVATDMVQTLSQLRGYSPASTTVQLRPGEKGFYQNLERALKRSGYGLQYLSQGESGDRQVSYDVETFEDEYGKSLGYRVRIGKVELSREYQVEGSRLFPVTSMSVKGVSPVSTMMDGSIFDHQVVIPSKEKKADPDTRQKEGKAKDWRAVPSSEEKGWQVVPSSEEALSLLISHPQGLAIAAPRKEANVFDSGTSNYNTSGYTVEDELVLVFANDSMKIGSTNKIILQDMAARFDKDTDLLSVMGCSMGRTSIPNGNELLAVGRANRVKEELIMASIPAESILDEGCWSGERDDQIPARGVVVTHHRSAI